MTSTEAFMIVFLLTHLLTQMAGKRVKTIKKYHSTALKKPHNIVVRL